MRYRILLMAVVVSATVYGQTFRSANRDLDSALALAVRTLDMNTHDGIIHAGAGYGGEWTRDCAINCRNAASMLRPESAEKSLWSVTTFQSVGTDVRSVGTVPGDRNQSLGTVPGDRIVGHQYWDKILWVIAAWNHYLWTGDEEFLKEAYACGERTMRELEEMCYDTTYQMFRGPAVFQDGIEAYDEPIFDPGKWDDSFVLHHPHGGDMMCLSSNLVYAEAYRVLEEMRGELVNHWGQSPMIDGFNQRGLSPVIDLRQAIRRNLLSKEGRLNYLVDYTGRVHEYQEGLGIGLALLYDLTDSAETRRMMGFVQRSKYGITSVSPCFPRNSAEKPGRHNVMVWPHVNALFASGCLHKGLDSLFYDEVRNQYVLALQKGCFYEIYTVEGVPSGGYQCKALWDEKPDQTWCATGFLRNIIEDMCGVRATVEGLEFHPVGMEDGSECVLKGIKYRGAEVELRVKGHGRKIASCRINGRRSEARIERNAKGKMRVEIRLEE